MFVFYLENSNPLVDRLFKATVTLLGHQCIKTIISPSHICLSTVLLLCAKYEIMLNPCWYTNIKFDSVKFDCNHQRNNLDQLLVANYSRWLKAFSTVWLSYECLMNAEEDYVFLSLSLYPDNGFIKGCVLKLWSCK